MKRQMVVGQRAQADRFLGELEAGLRECGAYPERGRRREEVRVGCWLLLVRRHVGFYTVTADQVLDE